MTSPTYPALKAECISQLQKLYEPREAGQIFDLLWEHLTGLGRKEMMFRTDYGLDEVQFKCLNQQIAQLKTGRPIQYVTGEAWFMGHNYLVNEHTLIPRGETEELVAWVLESMNTVPARPISVLDIGTGSGCIAISLALGFAAKGIGAEVRGMDISKPALETAALNARRMGAEVSWQEKSILMCRNESAASRYDCIVSNPPYIPLAEISEMHPNVVDFEPHLALFVPDAAPLIFYEAIADYASLNLKAKGSLFFEAHAPQASKVVAMLIAKGFGQVELRKDIHGRERMLRAVKSN